MSATCVALISGAGSGIGRSTALAFLKAGYDVVVDSIPAREAFVQQ